MVEPWGDGSAGSGADLQETFKTTPATPCTPPTDDEAIETGAQGIRAPRLGISPISA